MFVSDCLNVNSRGHLTIGGMDAAELAASYGTPLYIMDEDEIRRACRRYKQSIEDNYGGRGMVAYASKAFCCKAMCRLVSEEGMGLDVVSGSELYTALSAGFPAEKIFFHGNNKTPEELTAALESGVGRIVVDNLFELELLDQLAKSAGRVADIQFRIKPGVEAHTHDFVKTGGIDSKFGLGLENGEAMEAMTKAVSLSNINVKGIHCHIGSQIFGAEPFEHAAEVMLGFAAEVKKRLGLELRELNLGGGYGIRYMPGDRAPAYHEYMEKVAKTIRATCKAKGLAMPFVIMEPGRSIAGPAGITLYRVGAIKEIAGVRTYVTVDGGMADNPRYALYGAEYQMLLAAKATEPKDTSVTVAGRCCESGDLLGENVLLQKARVGDVLAVLATGAYNYSMSSNYNRLPRPPVVFVSEGKARVVVRRETAEDVARNDM